MNYKKPLLMLINFKNVKLPSELSSDYSLHQITIHELKESLQDTEYFEKTESILFFIPASLTDSQKTTYKKLLSELKQSLPAKKLILVSYSYDITFAIWALRKSFWDYILFPGELHRISLSIEPLRVESANPSQYTKTVSLNVDPNSKKRRTSYAFEYINENYTSAINIAELAKKGDFPLETFSRLFKKEYGITAIGFLVQLRINKAKRLLAQPESRISQIAYRIGYNNVAHFNRAFKKIVGVNPTEFRERYETISTNE